MSNILTSRVQSFMVDDVDYSLGASSAQITANPTDFRALGAAAPENEYTLDIELGQDLTTASLWTLAFTSANTAVAVILKPYGNNDEPTALKPWVYTEAVVAEPTDALIGGGSETSTTTKRTSSMSWPCSRPQIIDDILDIPA